MSSRQEVYVSPPGSGRGERVDTPVYELGHLDVGDVVPGPALIIDATQTIFVNASVSLLVVDEAKADDVQNMERNSNFSSFAHYAITP